MSRLPLPPPEVSATLAAPGALSDPEHIDALLLALHQTLRGLTAAALRRKRDQLLEHFAHCGGSYALGCAVLALVDLHLARRTNRPRPGQEAGYPEAETLKNPRRPQESD